MTEKEYRQHPAISRSELWRINESPEKFLYFKEHPPVATPALLFGQVVHKMVLLPDDFETDFAVMPDIDRRTKAGKDEYAAFMESVGDRAVVTPDMVQTAAEMIEQLHKSRIASEYLYADGENEVPCFWTDPDTGVDCKCRADRIIRNGDTVTIVDYKSARDASTGVFNSEVFKFGYAFQAAMYSEGVMRSLGLTERPEFVFVVQEKKPPYSINVITTPNEVMLYGIDQFREFIGTYAECMTTGIWYGFNGIFDDVNELFLPGYISLGVEEDDDE